MERAIELAAAMLAGGTVTAIITTIGNRRRNQAHARSVEVRGELAIVDTATSLVETLRAEIDRISERVRVLEDENRQMRLEMVRMTAEISELRVENAMLSKERDYLTARLESDRA